MSFELYFWQKLAISHQLSLYLPTLWRMTVTSTMHAWRSFIYFPCILTPKSCGNVWPRKWQVRIDSVLCWSFWPLCVRVFRVSSSLMRSWMHYSWLGFLTMVKSFAGHILPFLLPAQRSPAPKKSAAHQTIHWLHQNSNSCVCAVLYSL